MKPAQVEKWKVTRQKGMWRYVLLTGVLSYGLSCFVVVTFIVDYLMGQNALTAENIAFAAVLWAIGGVVFGWAMWSIQERQFRRATEGTGAG